MAVTKQVILDVFRDIESGEDPIVSVKHDSILPRFDTRRGFQIELFDDCGSCDYVQSVKAPNGDRWAYEDEEDHSVDVADCDDVVCIHDIKRLCPALLREFERSSAKFWFPKPRRP